MDSVSNSQHYRVQIRVAVDFKVEIKLDVDAEPNIFVKAITEEGDLEHV